MKSKLAGRKPGVSLGSLLQLSIITTFIFLGFVTLLVPGAHISAAPAGSSANGQGNPVMAPDFELTDLSGKKIALADYKGKVLFLNFWATWCPPCREEIPDFIEAYKENKDKGLEILGVSLDTKSKDFVIAFVEKYKINYPVVLESKSKTQRLIDDYEPGQFIPTTIIIDKQGRVRHKQVGLMNKATLLKYFRQYASEPS
ncbi:MAG: TlpA disulfide reductase family protein [Clostridiales bacterium]|nr:TlpA disulfide reductase family protein [Clostridiales bacterium]